MPKHAICKLHPNGQSCATIWQTIKTRRNPIFCQIVWFLFAYG